jgi:hypothetical protein
MKTIQRAGFFIAPRKATVFNKADLVQEFQIGISSGVSDRYFKPTIFHFLMEGIFHFFLKKMIRY